MQTQRNILIAFVLNLSFSLFELLGGWYTGSVAILSDAVHDLGDAASIGISFFWERISRRQPDATHTYGYGRYSVIGSVITTLILLFGSCVVIYNAIGRILRPAPIHYDGMILFAVVGVCVNLIAAFFTREGTSLNQKAVNLHMLEDVLGWAVVLAGGLVMRFTNWSVIDPILSIGVAVFILVHAIGNLKEVLDLFLEKTPQGMDLQEISKHLCQIDGVLDVHHIHIWSMDGQANYATMHIVTDGNPHTVKEAVREELSEHGITHATLELEQQNEPCHAPHCHVDTDHSHSVHHHHHH